VVRVEGLAAGRYVFEVVAGIDGSAWTKTMDVELVDGEVTTTAVELEPETR